MGIDAVILLRPKKPSLLRGVLDPERHSVTVLDDGALLLNTFMSYADIELDPAAGFATLQQYGAGLIAAHDDPRGFLFFPDVCEPKGRSYEDVANQIGAAGMWIPARELSDAERADLRRRTTTEPIVSPEALLQGLPLTGSFEDLIAGVESKLAGVLASAPADSLYGELAKELRALSENPNAFRGEESRSALLLQRPSRRPLGAKYPGLDLNSRSELADGTLVLHTDRGGQDAPEMIALALGEQLAEWVSDHSDPRGVPVFRPSAIASLASAATYDEAVARLDDVVFVVPHTIDDVIAERKARFRAFLATD